MQEHLGNHRRKQRSERNTVNPPPSARLKESHMSLHSVIQLLL